MLKEIKVRFLARSQLEGCLVGDDPLFFLTGAAGALFFDREDRVFFGGAAAGSSDRTDLSSTVEDAFGVDFFPAEGFFFTAVFLAEAGFFVEAELAGFLTETLAFLVEGLAFLSDFCEVFPAETGAPAAASANWISESTFRFSLTFVEP